MGGGDKAVCASGTSLLAEEGWDGGDEAVVAGVDVGAAEVDEPKYD